MKNISPIEVVAVAISAWRHNNNTLIKQAKTPGMFTNYALMRKAFGLEVNQDVPLLTVTDEDREQAEEIINFVKGKCLFDTIKEGEAASVIGKINRRFCEDEIAVSGVNLQLLSVVPKMYFVGTNFDDIKAKVDKFGANSNWTGTYGDAVKLFFRFISMREMPQIKSYEYLGHDGMGNLIRFVSKQKHFTKDTRITGYIRDLARDDKFNNKRFTVLNYVKEAK